MALVFLVWTNKKVQMTNRRCSPLSQKKKKKDNDLIYVIVLPVLKFGIWSNEFLYCDGLWLMI